MKRLLKLLTAATAATLSSTALFADPFSGVIVEGGLGSSQIKGETWSGQGALKERQFAGRLGVGYGYTVPAVNLNLVGLLTYNVGEPKLRQNLKLVDGTTSDQYNWTSKLKNTWELRFQPSYYIVPLRTLVYGTVGYAGAKWDGSGQQLLDYRLPSGESGRAVDPDVQATTNLNGYVLGIGVKYSPISLTHLYVGVDYSRISYNSKKVSSSPSRVDLPNGNYNFFVWTMDTGKIKTDTVLVTVGYYF